MSQQPGATLFAFDGGRFLRHARNASFFRLAGGFSPPLYLVYYTVDGSSSRLDRVSFFLPCIQ